MGYTPARSISIAFANGDHSRMTRARGGNHAVNVNAPVKGRVRYNSGWMIFSTNSVSSLRPAMTTANENVKSVSRHQAAIMRPGSRTGGNTLNKTQTEHTITKDVNMATLNNRARAIITSRTCTL